MLEHDGPWNVNTALSAHGVLSVSSQRRDGNVVSVRLFPSCGAAKMVHITSSGSGLGGSVAVPLGMSAREAGAYFGFNVRDCSTYSFGRGLGCGIAYEAALANPIQHSDGEIPCAPGKPVQFDFQPSRGMVGVTCGATKESLNSFVKKVGDVFGPAQMQESGALHWRLGQYVISASEDTVLGTTLRKVSVFESEQ